MTMVDHAGPDDVAETTPTTAMSLSDHVELIKWHLGRYDARRESTASRASVVLSAAAILSAGEAIVLGQVSGDVLRRVDPWPKIVLGVLVLTSSFLVIGSLIRASQVLVTRRPSRALFGEGGSLPRGLIFNGTDTVALLKTFADFRRALVAQDDQAVFDAAAVELWVTIQQHRRRYAQLRSAVALLQLAAFALILILIEVIPLYLAGKP